MTDLLMDLVENDLKVISGDLSLAQGITAIQQDLQQTLQFWLGEWFLDTTVGIPYRQQILVKNPNLDLVQADLVNAALNVPGITQITDFSMQYSSTNRTASVFITALTSTGQVIKAQAQVNTPTNTTIEGTPT